MTNKPMLSVERELLEQLRNVCGDPDLAAEANAILSKPMIESQYDGMTQGQAQSVSDGVDEILHGKPAAKHQGDPVALQHMAVAEDGKLRWMTGRKMQGCELYAMPDGSAIRSKLYAEQPAPVAVMPEPYSLAMFQMISGFDSLTPEQFDLVWSACRAEMGRLNGVKS